MNPQFPRTTVGGKSLSRIIIGTNWLMGWSHTGPAADAMIRARHSDVNNMVGVINAYQEYGIDTIMGPISEHPHLQNAIALAQEKTGKKLILVDTPTLNVADTPEARREAAAQVRHSKEIGTDFCLLHHSCAEQLVNKGKQEITRLDDYTAMIRENGMLPGLSAHMPELIVYSDLNGYDVETYIQIYNCMGFLMQVEIETVNAIIHSAKKPVMTIKSMAAGRCTPFVGLNFSWNTLRECDMVTLGCFTEREVHEDVEISFAALERRRPNLERRASPNQNQAAFGK